MTSKQYANTTKIQRRSNVRSWRLFNASLTSIFFLNICLPEYTTSETYGYQRAILGRVLEYRISMFRDWIQSNSSKQEGVHGVRSNSPPPLHAAHFLISHKIEVRPNYFIFMGYLRKRDKISKATPPPHTHTRLNMYKNSPEDVSLWPMIGVSHMQPFIHLIILKRSCRVCRPIS